MAEPVTVQEVEYLDYKAYSRTVFGFWSYLMTDCILFATLFAVYLVLHNNTFGGPSSKELFDLPYALTETVLLLISSFICGPAMLAAHRLKKHLAIAFFSIAFLLGLSFVIMEVSEFTKMFQEENSWRRSAFLSSYFTLVGTHGLHVSIGLLWMLVMMVQVGLRGITLITLKRLMCLSMFWHFLDIVWIFIFTVVYLMGKMT